ncbi:GNAT family N-acetyltransferase [Eudoraea sp.]|uniref:GNAT family N-acetyltransferase n=1 Tax=Eudoraea sp. TaxID=1979955 RepID=UPI003C7137C6
MDNIIIRKANIEDLETLLNFEQELIKAERPFDPTIKSDPVCYYELHKILVNSNAVVYVAEWTNKIVSCGSVTIRPARPYLDHKEFANFGFMYTVPEYRGRGINKRIMEQCKEWSLSRGFKEMRLTVYTDNQAAIWAYEKVGFKKHIIQMRLPLT